MFISHYNGHGIKLVRPLSTVDNARDYARVSHSRQWSNYNIEMGRSTTYNGLYHISSTLPHVACECVHVDLSLDVSLVQQRVQRNKRTRPPNPGTETATHAQQSE